MIVFHISGENEELAKEELRSLYEAYGKLFSVSVEEGLLLLATNDLDENALSRLAFTHESYIVEKLTDRKKLDGLLLELEIKKGQSFCVRCLGFDNNSEEERRAGEVIYESKRNKVDLWKPDVAVYLIKIKDMILVSTRRIGTDDFSKRDQNKRPFFRPVALQPKFARLLVNLARLKKGDTALDPFCGAGSILIEAVVMGIKPIGRDLDRKMVWGCRRNLDFYNLKADVDIGDATDIKLSSVYGLRSSSRQDLLRVAKRGPKTVDAIVTDPPYARASKMFTKDLKKLYLDFLKSTFKVLKKGGYLVAAAPTTKDFPWKAAGFEKVAHYDYYVHASLTRRIYILRRPK